MSKIIFNSPRRSLLKAIAIVTLLIVNAHIFPGVRSALADPIIEAFKSDIFVVKSSPVITNGSIQVVKNAAPVPVQDIAFATTLSPGGIAIIGVRADDVDGTLGNGNDDAFAWVPLGNLAPGAEIFFTDSGWTAGNTFRGFEGAIKYTAPAGGLAAGTVMLLEFTNSAGNYVFTPSGGGGTYSDADDAIVGTSGLLPATPGDNLFIFEGSTAAPSFVWGWKNEGPFDADSTSNDTTALPPGLTVGINAMSVDLTSSDNNRYVGPTSGSAASLAAAIANSANWETTDALPFPSGGTDITNGTLGGGGFTIGSPTPTPTPILPTPTDTPTPIPPTPTPTDTPTPIPPTPTPTDTPTPIPPTPTDTPTPIPPTPTPTDTPTPIPPTPTPTPTDTPTPIPPTPTDTPVPPTPTPTDTPTPIPPTPTFTPTPIPPTPTPTNTPIPNHPPTADPNGPYLGAAGSPITFDGTGSSDPDGDIDTYDWYWGDGSTSMNSGSTPDHTYAAAEIYDVCLTVTDTGGLSDTMCTIAVAYDPDAGFVTGGGWIDSPEGAYKADPTLTGNANFGFVSKYKKGASVPTGNTEFQFQTAALNFHSSSYRWLVVNHGGSWAMFKGQGSINGDFDTNGNPYKFMLWAGDGDPDTFRIRIWWEDSYDVEHDEYDNGSNQPIGGGSIIVHKGKGK